MSEKTEQPTPRRLKKAREDGQHPRSRVLGAALPMLCVVFAGADLPPEGEKWIRAALSTTSSPTVLIDQGVHLWWVSISPLLLAASLGALAAGLLQSGLHFDLSTLAPKAERIDVAAGLKRIFTLKAVPDALRPAAAILVVVTVGAVALHAAVERSRALPRLDGVAQLLTASSAVVSTLKTLTVWVAALAAADLLLGRWLHLRGLRMSRDEVKQEHKSQEGDPHHKSKRRAFHRQLALAGPARSVAQATVVVVNPTHIAVALRYAPDECGAPYVVARGRDDDAFDIRKAARSMNVPIVRDVPLARALVHCQPGDEIPEELFQAAAAILKTVLPPELSPPKGALS
jgi:type III secretion protein U